MNTVKKTTLSKLHDGQLFKLSTKSKAAVYKVNTKKKGEVIFTSEASNKTYTKPGITIAYTF